MIKGIEFKPEIIVEDICSDIKKRLPHMPETIEQQFSLDFNRIMRNVLAETTTTNTLLELVLKHFNEHELESIIALQESPIGKQLKAKKYLENEIVAQIFGKFQLKLRALTLDKLRQQGISSFESATPTFEETSPVSSLSSQETISPEKREKSLQLASHTMRFLSTKLDIGKIIPVMSFFASEEVRTAMAKSIKESWNEMDQELQNTLGSFYATQYELEELNALVEFHDLPHMRDIDEKYDTLETEIGKALGRILVENTESQNAMMYAKISTQLAESARATSAAPSFLHAFGLASRAAQTMTSAALTPVDLEKEKHQQRAASPTT